MKLNIELVPESAWFKNLRNLVGQNRWDEIRHQVYKDYSYCCGICKEKGNISCHEIWDYNEEKKIQKLVRYIALCDNCHNIKHIGLSQIRSQRGELDFSKLIEHFMIVNNCTLEEYKEHKEKAFEIWADRSKIEWKLDLSNFMEKKEEQKILF